MLSKYSGKQERKLLEKCKRDLARLQQSVSTAQHLDVLKKNYTSFPDNLSSIPESSIPETNLTSRDRELRAAGEKSTAAAPEYMTWRKRVAY